MIDSSSRQVGGLRQDSGNVLWGYRCKTVPTFVSVAGSIRSSKIRNPAEK